MAKKTTLEENLIKLDEIVRELEKGEISLSKSLELFEKGVKLSKECTEEIENAKIKIKELVNGKEEDMTVEGF